MATPGWYPDPGGAPDQYRYWDGSQWSEGTSDTPGGPPPGTGAGSPARRKLPLPAIIGGAAGIVVIGLIVALLVFNPFSSERTDGPVDTSSPSKSAWNETSSPSPTPTTASSGSPTNPQSSGGSAVTCPNTNGGSRQSKDVAGKLTGGGLTVSQIPGWSTPGTLGLTFATDVQAQRLTVTSTWFNDIAVGALRFADGFDSPQQSAEIVMQCLASSGYYDGFTSRKDLVSEAMLISHKQAWHIRSEIHVDDHEGENIAGDVVDVIVIDSQQGEYLSLFQGSSTIGRTDIFRQVETAMSSVQVA